MFSFFRESHEIITELVNKKELRDDVKKAFKEGWQELELGKKFFEGDTPLCFAPFFVVSKTGHHIAFALSLIMVHGATYALLNPCEKGTLIGETGNNIEVEFLGATSLIAASAAFLSATLAGITLFCTKKEFKKEEAQATISSSFKANL